MRYSIVLHTEKMKEWGLNLTEATIFSFCYELPSWADSIIIDGVTMFRGNRRKASEEMGLDLAPDTIYRAYKKLHDKGLIVYAKNGSDDLIALSEIGKTWGVLGKKSEHSEKNPSKLGKISERTRIIIRPINLYQYQITNYQIILCLPTKTNRQNRKRKELGFLTTGDQLVNTSMQPSW